MIHLAYLDPGTGSIFLQTVIGGVLGAVYVLRKWLGAIIKSIRRPGKSASVHTTESVKES